MTPVDDWLFGALGGALIGLASTLLLGLIGRIAGISGIVGGLVEGRADGFAWRAAFVAGLVFGPFLFAFLAGHAPPVRIAADWPLLVAGGLLVGFGTRLGGGCTSGHGVCGLGRLSGRSLVAVATFFAVALVTVYATHHLIGG